MADKPIMRYHGAKFRIAHWVMSFFPDHYTYVEPFGGAAGVLLQKPRSMSEVYNDLDGDIVNVFRVLQDPGTASALVKKIQLTPYSRDEFLLSYESTDEPVERARRTLIRAQMGFGSAGASKHRTGFRIDSARAYGTAAELWSEYPDSIASFCGRLKGVIIENKDAVEVIQNHDRPDTLFYVDPPYMQDLRVMGGHKFSYRHEMTDQDHENLLKCLVAVKGLVVVSGYDNDLYNDLLTGWVKQHTKARASAGRGGTTRVETVWLNPRCAVGHKQPQLFDNQRMNQ